MQKVIRENRIYVLLLDAVRIVNILNASLLLGIKLSNIGFNRYLSLIIILVSCGVLSFISQMLFIKKFGKENLLTNNKIYAKGIIFVILLTLTYYIIAKEYVIAAITLFFFTGYFIWMKWLNYKGKRKRKLMSVV